MTFFDKNFSLITGYRFLIREVIYFIEKIDEYSEKQNSKILDIGCGNKPYKKLFSRYQYIGMDYDSSVSKPDIIGTMAEIPFAESTLDACMTVWVLDDLPDPETGIKEIARVLRYGGYYFAIENQSTRQHFSPNDYFRFAPHALIYLCDKHNLKLIHCTPFGGNFALIGFCLINECKKIFEKLKINILMEPAYCAFINTIFALADKIARLKCFHGAFEDNSIGYCYVFKKGN